jgi:hypothetical protein
MLDHLVRLESQLRVHARRMCEAPDLVDVVRPRRLKTPPFSASLQRCADLLVINPNTSASRDRAACKHHVQAAAGSCM